jgi:hypothetical protein
MSTVKDSHAAYPEPGNGRRNFAPARAATDSPSPTPPHHTPGRPFPSTWQDVQTVMHRHPEWTLLVGLSLGVAFGWLVKRR